MKRIDRLTVKIEPITEFGRAMFGTVRLRFEIVGDGERVGYDQIIDQEDLTKSVFDHMWESAKLKIEEAFNRRPAVSGKGK